MPEGDTVHRIARILGAELPGRRLDGLELRDLGPVHELAGHRIGSVEARGKHLLLHLDGDWTLRVHLGMHGRWRRQHVREPKPAHATVVLVTGEVAYVCARAYRAELVRTRTLRSHARLARLGPDLLDEPPAIDEAVRRALLPAHANREIADLLLDQRIAAGIGNVYKSEVLFERKVHPRTPVGQLAAGDLRALFETAAHLLRLNLLTRGRATVPIRRRPRPSRTRLWVYGRAGKPCLDCGTSIERFLQGDTGRDTWFCPGCQVGHPGHGPPPGTRQPPGPDPPQPLGA